MTKLAVSIPEAAEMIGYRPKLHLQLAPQRAAIALQGRQTHPSQVEDIQHFVDNLPAAS